MLAAVRWLAVIAAVGAGTLTATIMSLILWGILTAVGVDDAPGLALVVGMILAFAAAGYTAGRMAIHSHRFHGSLAGLALATLWVIVFRLGGSQAPTVQVLILAIIGIVLGGMGGMLGRRRPAP